MSAVVSEHEILEALRQAPRERWGEVLEFVAELRAPSLQCSNSFKWTAAELLKLPVEERERVLAEQAAKAVADYTEDRELTAFDAYGEDDLHVDSSDTQTR